MTATVALLERFREAGGSVEFRPPGSLIVRAPKAVRDRYRDELRRRKPAILEHLRRPDPVDLITEAVPDATVTATHPCIGCGRFAFAQPGIRCFWCRPRLAREIEEPKLLTTTTTVPDEVAANSRPAAGKKIDGERRVAVKRFARSVSREIAAIRRDAEPEDVARAKQVVEPQRRTYLAAKRAYDRVGGLDRADDLCGAARVYVAAWRSALLASGPDDIPAPHYLCTAPGCENEVGAPDRACIHCMLFRNPENGVSHLSRKVFA